MKYKQNLRYKLKKIFHLTLIGFVVLVCSCATKIPVEQTCLTCIQSQRLGCRGAECPETIMANNECIVLIGETGERINMNYILSQEGIVATRGIPVAVAKIRGRYLLTGLGFKNLWVLTPSKNTAKVKPIKLPQNNLSLPPVFEISNSNLLMRGEKNDYSYIFDIDNLKWLQNVLPKAGR